MWYQKLFQSDEEWEPMDSPFTNFTPEEFIRYWKVVADRTIVEDRNTGIYVDALLPILYRHEISREQLTVEDYDQ